jgi:hypothetical protein
MSAAKIILDSLLPTSGPWEADERGIIVLTVMPDVVVNIVEDETMEEVHFLSAAGYPDAEGGTTVELDSADAGEGVVTVYMAEQTGLVMVLRTVSRQRLNERAFLKELTGHVNFTRMLAARLAPTAPEGAAIVDEHDKANWLPCLANAVEAPAPHESAPRATEA